jgi:cysteine-S-conjugate beta-lyase
MHDTPGEARPLHPHTLLVHGAKAYAGNPVRASTPPIYLSATFANSSLHESGEYHYSRGGNPTRDALEAKLAALEGCAGVRSFACMSGVGALHLLLAELEPGDRVLCSQDVYGGTFRLFGDAWQRRGVGIDYCDASDLTQLAKGFTPRTRLVHIEPVGNPMMSVCDVARIAELAHERGALLSVDNTSLCSLHCKPLALGADIAIQSATKYLCGHGDVTAGVFSVRDAQRARRIGFHHNSEGMALAPFDCYMLHRSMESLAPRLAWQERTARELAARLQATPGVLRVRHPSLLHGAAREVHVRQSTGDGCVISFETGIAAASARVIDALRLFAIRVSFGSVTSSASVPFGMSHRGMPKEVAHLRPPEDLIRLSIGVEDVEDLWADLSRALALVR